MARRYYFLGARALRISPFGPMEYFVLHPVQANPVFGVICLVVPHFGQVNVIMPIINPPFQLRWQYYTINIKCFK